jgi:hypothetical protein
MEVGMEFLIGGVLIGVCLVLTIRNTILLRQKAAKPEEVSDEQKRREEEYEALMNYRGRA